MLWVGSGVVGMASPMLQEVFGCNLIGVAKKFGDLDKEQLTAIAGLAAGCSQLGRLLASLVP
jgi:hypothetical protein